MWVTWELSSIIKYKNIQLTIIYDKERQQILTPEQQEQVNVDWLIF